MLPNLKKSGLLPTGMHPATWNELVEKFGFNNHRLNLLQGLKKGLNLLYQHGCTEAYIDGSFATSKPFPNDVDVCYDNTRMNWKNFIKEQPEFNDIRNGNKIQKEKYQSEFYAYNAFEYSILQFFQFDRDHNPKGIVKLNLNEVFYDQERKTI
jgi:hypothetical protein